MTESSLRGVRNMVVLVAGATSASGEAVCRALNAAGARVIASGRRADALDALSRAVPGIVTKECDLGDKDQVADLVENLHAEFGMVDGLVHLVGGYRGGGGLAGQSDEDWDFLEAGFRTLRNTTRALYSDLMSSEAGRIAVVSSTSVEHPTAGSANYAALKAATDAWVRACGQGFSQKAPRAAAVIFVVRGLAGLEDVLGEGVVNLWDRSAGDINGMRIPLALDSVED